MGCFIWASKNQAQASSFPSSVYSFFATTPVERKNAYVHDSNMGEGGRGVRASFSLDNCRAAEELAPNRHQIFPVPLYMEGRYSVLLSN